MLENTGGIVNVGMLACPGAGNAISLGRDSSTDSLAGALNVKMALPGMIGLADGQSRDTRKRSS